jgi:unsaturated rhamnogalacturonyl hydrolase
LGKFALQFGNSTPSGEFITCRLGKTKAPIFPFNRNFNFRIIKPIPDGKYPKGTTETLYSYFSHFSSNHRGPAGNNFYKPMKITLFATENPVYKTQSHMPVLWLLVVFLFTLDLQAASKQISKGLEMSVRMADSEMKHFPEPWTVDFNPKPVWSYTQGLIAQSLWQVWVVTGNNAYYDYARSYADKMIDETGVINGYKIDEYNLDRLNSGKFLFDLYDQTRNEKYKKAIFMLREQLKTHPRTAEGGFWHKKVYPHQMWLDGLYMGAPFYARFARDFREPEAFNDVIDQFVNIHKHAYDPKSGLYFHGWDESKQQKWANPVTGCSPHVWGRAMGWFSMALADVLDFIPVDHPRRGEIIDILNQVADGVKKHQDKKTGLWYQVMDQGDREGNYLEATASSMFACSLLKAVRKGYISKKYRKVAIKGYHGILNSLIRENGDGTISLTRCCAVAGLGGNPYRDGSYDYYIHEPVRDNDPKGVGPFIMAGLEMNLIKK